MIVSSELMNNETKLLKLLDMTHQDRFNKLAIHKRKKKRLKFLLHFPLVLTLSGWLNLN